MGHTERFRTLLKDAPAIKVIQMNDVARDGEPRSIHIDRMKDRHRGILHFYTLPEFAYQEVIKRTEESLGNLENRDQVVMHIEKKLLIGVKQPEKEAIRMAGLLNAYEHWRNLLIDAEGELSDEFIKVTRQRMSFIRNRMNIS